MTVLAVDAGQGGTRAVVLASDGTVLARGEAGGVSHLATRDGPSATADALAVAIRNALGTGSIPDIAVIAISGWTRNARRRDDLLGRVALACRIPRLLLTSDAVAGFFASPPDGCRVSLAVGTGTVAIGADGTGAWALVDGVGHLLGDEGSGYWIGHRGLVSALAVADGRGGSDVLFRAASARFGDPADIPDCVYGHPHPVSAVASFAPDVATAAIGGDPVALGIITSGGEALARTAVAAAERICGEAPVTVALTGNVMTGSSPLIDVVRAAIQARRPDTTILLHDRQPLEGAAYLAREPQLLATWFPGLVSEGPR